MNTTYEHELVNVNSELVPFYADWIVASRIREKCCSLLLFVIQDTTY